MDTTTGEVHLTPGHRQLTKLETLSVQLCRDQGVRLEELLCELQDRGAVPRWVAIARTHFQEGLMAAVRSITKPDFF